MTEDSSSKYKIAVIMPVLNESRYIARTLETIYMQDFPMEQVEVIVADGGSVDGTRDIVERFKSRFGSLKIMDNPRKKPSSGRNVGLKNSTAPLVIIVDGHCHIPDNNLFKSMVELFEKYQADCLCRPQPLDPPDINEFEISVALCRGSILGHKPGSEIYANYEGEVDPTSSGAMYKRTVFDRVGNFDESFDACEDVEFNYRVSRTDLKSVLSPRLKIFYYPRSTIASLWKQMNRYGLGRFRLSKKHKIFSPIQWLAAGGVIGFAFLLLMSILFTPVFGLFKSIVGIYLLILITFSGWQAVRHKHLECLFYGPLIYPTIHFGLGIGFLKGVIESLTINRDRQQN